MANLFNKKILQQKIKDFSIPDIESKLTQVKNWQRNLASIKGINEKRLQAKFLQSFFEDILGYDNSLEKNEWTLDIEVSSDVDAKTPDGVLGFYSRDDDGKEIKSHHAVIELKGPQVSLDKDQRRGGTTYKSPVDQAFSYIQRLDKCKWIIVSNFIEIRLYQVGRSKEYFETFYLRDLDDIDEFKRFYYILSQENLISRNENSNTYKLTQATQKRDEDISNEFYTLYSQTRVDLFEHILENNKKIEAEIALEKSQKFLDRIIFICFCEDKNLLPNDLLHNAIEQGKNSFLSDGKQVWPQIKGVFKAIDKGYPDRNINAFNGGLFENDIILDNLIIKDDFFEVIYRISDYDFDSDVDVNILGHIFEQSISDIEKLKSDIQDNEYDSSESRRKKEGIYYTPRYITRYIVEQAIGGYLEDIKKELGYYGLPNIEDAGSQSWKTQYSNQHLNFYKIYEDKLKEIKVLDPACGSGAFLNQAFDFLLNEHKWVNDQRDLIAGVKSIFAVDSAQRNILKNNLYGVDLNEESVEITKLSLWLKTANKRKPLTNLDDNIKCGNSLIDDFEIAGGKAFVWEDEFQEIIVSGGFDVVIGNPPWVSFGLRGTGKLSNQLDHYYRETYKVAEYKLSVYSLFVERGIEVLKHKGHISYIIPDSFLLGRYFSNLRKYLLTNCTVKSILMTSFDVFSSQASTGRNVIFLFQKIKNDSMMMNINLAKSKDDFSSNSFQGYFYNQSYFRRQLYNRFRLFFKEDDFKIINKINKGDKLDANFGLYSGCIARHGQKSIISKRKEDEFFIKDGNRIVFEDYNALDKWKECIVSGGEFQKYTHIIPHHYMYINKNKEVLKIVGKSGFDFEKYEKEKLFLRQTGDNMIATYDDTGLYCLNNVHLVYNKTEKHNIKLLLGILNSKLVNYYYKKTTLEEGRAMAQTDIETVEKIPIRIKKLDVESSLVEKVNKMLLINKEMSKLKENFFLIFIAKYIDNSKRVQLKQYYSDKFSNFIYSGRARKLRNMGVDINSEIITIYTDKSSSGKYEILKFEEKNEYRRKYIKYYLENLSEGILDELNDLEGNILEKTLQISIPDYDKEHVVRKVVSEWEKLQSEIRQLEEDIARTDEEIDQLVYELYGLTDEEIEIVDDSVN